MFKSRRSQNDQLDTLIEMVARIEAALVVRDPGNARSAEAYDGLRRTVVATGRDRRRHLAHLVAFSEAVDEGLSADGLSRLLTHWRNEEGLERSSDVDRPELFQVVEPGDGDLTVLEPAWVDTSGESQPVLVKQGLATRRTDPNRAAKKADE